MADKPTSIQLSPVDRKRLDKLRKFFTRQHGKASATFVMREALRSLESEIDAKKEN